MSTDRPRPPSVERLLAAVRPQLTDGAAPDAVAAVARDVVAGERARLAAGEDPTATGRSRRGPFVSGSRASRIRRRVA